MFNDWVNVWFFDKNHGRGTHEIKVSGKIIFDNILSAIEFSKNSLGIIYAPRYIIEQQYKNNKLIQTNKEELHYGIYIIGKNQTTCQAKVAIDEIKDSVVAMSTKI